MSRFRLIADDAKKFLLGKADLARIEKNLLKHIPYLRGEAAVAALAARAMRELNADYRGKDKTTNVLSFPQYDARHVTRALKNAKETNLYLGDIALHMPTIRAEAKQQKKPVKHHVVHLVVHGVLHLLGYDHMNGRAAAKMEELEIAILESCKIPDPYEDREPVPNRKKTTKTGSRTSA